jgi:hypothetical protein
MAIDVAKMALRTEAQPFTLRPRERRLVLPGSWSFVAERAWALQVLPEPTRVNVKDKSSGGVLRAIGLRALTR